ncbi:M1 family metallopeptidase [Olivibacter ginsenosidimutans]|uniref:M1 family metallopeptidase n=1 Tax=Olivibacter ginsenosidimutans TaxID=1176537 RepID=A0ABP9B9Z2_9SPHI
MAYERGTRDVSGKPGKNYWQNKGVYQMDLQVDDETKVVTGTETITYSNNSPDTLKSLAIRFVNNIHKPQAPRSGYVSADFLSEGLTISHLSINGKTYPIDASDWGTVGTIKLNEVIMPKSNATIEIAWTYPLSKQSGREGQIDANTFYVAYSYPRVSVYDDYNGWDMIPHTDRGEFYNDFNDYTFTVKAPKNYVVWATGDFLNPDEVLQAPIASRLKESYKSDQVIHVATAEEMKAGKVTTQQSWNIWKFKAEHIPDVCFALSNHYVWDASSVVVDPKTKRRASTQAAYSESSIDFVNSVKYSSYALSWFSNHWPGVPYPYSKMTAVQGFADMEYPMMVNDSETGNDAFGRFVQDHEIAHTYFPFYMGTNETRYAYMDEGWATTLEYLIALSYNDKKSADENYKNFRIKSYINDPSTEEDQPIISMSNQVSGVGYGRNSYGKASLSYLALKDLLGDALFKTALHTYMDNWNGKHPMPWDFFNSMNTGSGQDLNWFFQNWFFTNNYIDLKVGEVKQLTNKLAITAENIGGFAIPFDVVISYADGSEERQHFTPSVWKDHPKTIHLQVQTKKGIVKSVYLDGGIFMDATPKDNNWKENG